MKQNKRLITILISSAALLLIPLIAMKLTNEVNWKTSDFAVAGILLAGTGLALEFILRKTKTRCNRTILVISLILILLLIWAELAVGIFGTAIGGT